MKNQIQACGTEEDTGENVVCLRFGFVGKTPLSDVCNNSDYLAPGAVVTTR